MCYRQGDIDCAHQGLTTMYFSTRKENMESPWSNTKSVPRRGDQHAFPEPRRPPPWKRNKMLGTTYRFQEGDAADGTTFVPFGPCRSTRQFPSSETKHSTMIAGTGNGTNTSKKRKTLPQDYPRRLCVPSPSNMRQSGAKLQ